MNRPLLALLIIVLISALDSAAYAQTPPVTVSVKSVVTGIPYTRVTVPAPPIPGAQPTSYIIPGTIGFNQKARVTADHNVIMKTNATTAVDGQVSLTWSGSVSYEVRHYHVNNFTVVSSGSSPAYGETNKGVPVDVEVNKERTIYTGKTPVATDCSYTPQLPYGSRTSYGIVGTASTAAIVKGSGPISFDLLASPDSSMGFSMWQSGEGFASN